MASGNAPSLAFASSLISISYAIATFKETRFRRFGDPQIGGQCWAVGNRPACLVQSHLLGRDCEAWELRHGTASLPLPLSNPSCVNLRTMQTLVNDLNESWRRTSIARFGAARLVERAAGRAELRGGAGPERTEAKEWISLFAHELGLSFSSPTPEKGMHPRPVRAVSRLAGMDIP